MTTATEEPYETELNMTPMIDIVFQLIIFFLLSLKFKTIDQRIESMLPKKEGLAPTPDFAVDEDKIKVKVFRREIDRPDRAYTLVKVDNAAEFRLPAGWKGRLRESPDRLRDYDRTLASVRGEIQRRLAIYGNNPDAVKGEVCAPPPRGGTVPHGDVVAVLDTFLRLGITDVKFDGQMTPLNKRERAERNARR